MTTLCNSAYIDRFRETSVLLDVARANAVFMLHPTYISPEAAEKDKRSQRLMPSARGGSLDGRPVLICDVLPDGKVQVCFLDGTHRFCAMRDTGYRICLADTTERCAEIAKRCGLTVECKQGARPCHCQSDD